MRWLDPELRFQLHAEGDEAPGGSGGTNGTGGTNGATTGEEGGSRGPNWEAFAQSLEQSIGSQTEALIREVRGLKPEPPPPAQEPAPDFDTMTQSDLAAYITGRVTKAVETMLSERISPVVERVNGIQQSIGAREVTQQIDTLKSTKRDFNDWKPQMLELAKTHQTLSVPELYTLAKGMNPERATELDKKYADPPAPKPPRWGGLSPSGGVPGSSGGSDERLSGREATIAAYREVQAKNATVLRALEDL